MYFGRGFPFQEFGGGGRPRQEVENTKLYQALEIQRDADLSTIKKAYKTLAMKHHPDKGGDPEKFKEIGKAYEILSDPEKREKYDQYGEEGLEAGGGGGADPSDIFDMFFGGGGQRSARPGKRKGEDVVHPLKVGLEQLFTGFTKKMAINKEVICADCGGRGGPESALTVCNKCDGRGMRVTIQQMGPVIQQMRRMCENCQGQGKYIPQSKKCPKCKGECTVKQRKLLEVYVPPGAVHNHKVVLSGQADEKPGEIAGDVIFIVNEKPHEVFTRKGSDLWMKKDITLYEALTGFEFVIEHLDNRQLLIKNNPGQITVPNAEKCVDLEGMPLRGNQAIRGNLYVTFNIIFPTQLDEARRAQLADILPRPPPLNINMDSPDLEHHYVKDKEHAATQHVPDDQQAYDEDDEEREGGPRVQCRQQ